jgi:hypothetical protein
MPMVASTDGYTLVSPASFDHQSVFKAPPTTLKRLHAGSRLVNQPWC